MGTVDKSKNGFLSGLRRGKQDLALIAIRDMVIYPGVVTPIAIQRSKSIKALDHAEKNNRLALFVAQRKFETEDPQPKDLYEVGTVAKIKEVVRQPDGSVRILVEGTGKAKISDYLQLDPFIKVKADNIVLPDPQKTEKTEALMYSVVNQFKECVNLGATVPLDILLVVVNVTDPVQLANIIALNVEFKIKEKQEILEANTAEEKLDKVSQALSRQLKVLRMAKKLQSKTGEELNKMQKEVFLREQLKAIEKELGVVGGKSETEEMQGKIKKAGMPKKVEDRALKELRRLEGMPSFSPEISYLKAYLDWLVELPWSKKSKSKINIKQAKKILDEDHYGLTKAKERVLEYLAVQKLVGKIKGPILCLVGPPGTGKTSIGKSVARALGREFHRVSLGGLRDEAEIRGHRRTYVGALPGRIIQGIKSAGTKNPVFMLDEIDKVGADFHGDPSSALLEALDPEQNNEFSDHYLEVPFDLSDVMFITTANMLDTIPPALRDRMEVIRFPGYTEEEKFQIAKKYLTPRQMENNGVNNKLIAISDSVLRAITREYTSEAGVRNLEREIAAVCRKVAKKITENGKKKINVTAGDLAKYLGPPRYQITKLEKKDEVGVAAGLAWTAAGGEILHIEVTKMPGKGGLILTGHLGKVMKESAQAAFSFARAKVKELGVKDKFYKDVDVHIHVPSGAIPKDGPSAGTAIATALISVMTDKKVKRDVCMTGEITLRGKVMEIGGVKEKVLAAHRGGMKKVILPKNNEKDMVDIPAEVKKALKFVFVEKVDEVLEQAIVD
ncbi:MAG: endopeptidase La [Parcubacteria group bacterium]